MRITQSQVVSAALGVALAVIGYRILFAPTSFRPLPPSPAWLAVNGFPPRSQNLINAGMWEEAGSPGVHSTTPPYHGGASAGGYGPVGF